MKLLGTRGLAGLAAIGLAATPCQGDLAVLAGLMNDVMIDIYGPGHPTYTFTAVNSTRSRYGHFEPNQDKMVLNKRPYITRAQNYYNSIPNDANASMGVCSPFALGEILGTLIHEALHFCAENAGCTGFTDMSYGCQEFAIDTTVAAALCDHMQCVKCALEATDDPDVFNDLSEKLDGLAEKHRSIQEKYDESGEIDAACNCALDHGGPGSPAECSSCTYAGHTLMMPSKFDVQDAVEDGDSAIPDCPNVDPTEEWCMDNCDEDGNPQEPSDD